MPEDRKESTSRRALALADGGRHESDCAFLSALDDVRHVREPVSVRIGCGVSRSVHFAHSLMLQGAGRAALRDVRAHAVLLPRRRGLSRYRPVLRRRQRRGQPSPVEAGVAPHRGLLGSDRDTPSSAGDSAPNPGGRAATTRPEVVSRCGRGSAGRLYADCAHGRREDSIVPLSLERCGPAGSARQHRPHRARPQRCRGDRDEELFGFSRVSSERVVRRRLAASQHQQTGEPRDDRDSADSRPSPP